MASVAAAGASDSSAVCSTGSPRSIATTSARLGTATTRASRTRRASARLAGGTTTRRRPARAAARTAGSTPGTGRTRPSSAARRGTPPPHRPRRDCTGSGEDGDRHREVEPAATLGQGSRREAQREPVPRNGLTAVDDRRADAVRASCNAASGSPISVNAGRPEDRWASTSMTWPSSPTSAKARPRPSAISTPPEVLDLRGAGRASPDADDVEPDRRGVRRPPVGKPGSREGAQASQLAAGDSLGRRTEGLAAAGLHLTEYEGYRRRGRRCRSPRGPLPRGTASCGRG